MEKGEDLMIVKILDNDLQIFFSHQWIPWILFIFFIISSYTDIKHLKIYNIFNFIFLVVRIVFLFMPYNPYPLTISHLLGAIVGFLVLTIPAMALMHKMGGDIKFITVLGLYLGGPFIVLLLFLSCILMLLFSFVRKLITKKDIKKILVPFAPFFMISYCLIFMFIK